jgi:hypothetical protein
LGDVLDALGETIRPGGRLFVALREGTAQGYQGQPGQQRWFSNFFGAEFETYIPDEFHVVRRARTEHTSVTFLNYHLVRAGERD